MSGAIANRCTSAICAGAMKISSCPLLCGGVCRLYSDHSRPLSQGHTYVPAAPGSDDCCGHCERTACVVGGIEHAEGDTWRSEDGCTEFFCERDFFDNQLTVMSVAALCRDVSDCPKENLYTDETGCCQRCNRTGQSHQLDVTSSDAGLRLSFDLKFRGSNPRTSHISD